MKTPHLPANKQLSSARNRAAGDLCRAADDVGIPVRDLDQRTYRRWWLRRPSRCHMPTDVCVLFGTWDKAKRHAEQSDISA